MRPYRPHHSRLVVLHRLPGGEEVVVEEEHEGEGAVEAIDLPALRAATARHAMVGLLALALMGWSNATLSEGTLRTGLSLASGWVGYRNLRSYMRKRKLMQETHAAIRQRTHPTALIPFTHPEAP